MSTILIFDSSAVTCHTVSKQLRTYGFDTLQDRSLSSARAALASKSVDLVILDPALADASWVSGAPDAGGMALLRELRQTLSAAARTGHKVPVIILTSSARDSDRTDARAAGAAAFLTKPASTCELVSTVNSVLALHAPAARPTAQVVAAQARIHLVRRRDWRPERAPAPAAAAAVPGAATSNTAPLTNGTPLVNGVTGRTV